MTSPTPGQLNHLIALRIRGTHSMTDEDIMAMTPETADVLIRICTDKIDLKREKGMK